MFVRSFYRSIAGGGRPRRLLKDALQPHVQLARRADEHRHCRLRELGQEFEVHWHSGHLWFRKLCGACGTPLYGMI